MVVAEQLMIYPKQIRMESKNPVAVSILLTTARRYAIPYYTQVGPTQVLEVVTAGRRNHTLKIILRTHDNVRRPEKQAPLLAGKNQFHNNFILHTSYPKIRGHSTLDTRPWTPLPPPSATFITTART